MKRGLPATGRAAWSPGVVVGSKAVDRPRRLQVLRPRLERLAETRSPSSVRMSSAAVLRPGAWSRVPRVSGMVQGSEAIAQQGDEADEGRLVMVPATATAKVAQRRLREVPSQSAPLAAYRRCSAHVRSGAAASRGEGTATDSALRWACRRRVGLKTWAGAPATALPEAGLRRRGQPGVTALAFRRPRAAPPCALPLGGAPS